jgi:hypothetical protein
MTDDRRKNHAPPVRHRLTFPPAHNFDTSATPTAGHFPRLRLRSGSGSGSGDDFARRPSTAALRQRLRLRLRLRYAYAGGSVRLYFRNLQMLCSRDFDAYLYPYRYQLFAPCFAPRPTFRQSCINFLGEGRATSGTPAAGRQKPRRPAPSVEPSTARALSRRSHEDTPRPSVGAPLTIISPYRKPARSFVASCWRPIWKIIVPHALPTKRNRQRRQSYTIGRRRSHRRKNHAATAPATETNRQAVRIRLDNRPRIRRGRQFACWLLPPLSQHIEKTEPVKDEKFFRQRFMIEKKGKPKKFFPAGAALRVLD